MHYAYALCILDGIDSDSFRPKFCTIFEFKYSSESKSERQMKKRDRWLRWDNLSVVIIQFSNFIITPKAAMRVNWSKAAFEQP